MVQILRGRGRNPSAAYKTALTSLPLHISLLLRQSPSSKGKNTKTDLL